ncbi:MAG TPA: hypothetical protein VFP98_10335 [Candidatus Polarisedimenticolia bacterium]|nr:hypothetical protein [Candidatus Polarisedimenticolia bacterium]
MSERRIRLGDVVDDYCSRCRLLLNHGVMALAGETILKVRCNTCSTEHPYRNGKLPKRRKDPVRQAFDELMSRMPGGAAPSPPVGPPGRRGKASDEEPDED